jgi:integrase
MPKKAKELSALEVRRLTNPGLHAVGGTAGLLLQVSPVGARSWILRTIVGTKRRDIGLGGFPDVSIAQAREKARELKEQIRQGVDPVAQRKAARASVLAEQAKEITFDESARRYINSIEPQFSNIKQAAQWRSSLNDYASPVIGKLPVGSVDLVMIQKILDPIWTTKTETATRVRARMESVLAWATVSGYRKGDNPARWKDNLDKIMPKPEKLRKRKNFVALPWREAAAFMTNLRQRTGRGAKALEFLILTAARSGEVRGAKWGEIDFDANLWTIPAERMKNREEHTVPLCADAMKLLRSLPKGRADAFIFPGEKRAQSLSDVSIAKPLKAMGVAVTVHGFRSTFRDWCAESTNYPNIVAEKALAHTIPNAVERAYRRGELIEKRTKLMADWCKYLNKPAQFADVVPIRGQKAGK